MVFFDTIKEDEGCTKALESEAGLMLSSHGVRGRSPGVQANTAATKRYAAIILSIACGPSHSCGPYRSATERRLSDLVFQAAVRPLPAVGINGTVAVNVERFGVDAVNTGLEVHLRDDLTVEAGQTYVRNRQVDGIVAKILWKATNNLSLDLLTRYDIRSGTLLEETASARFSTCCWEVGLRFTHRIRGPGQSDENSLQTTFNLKMPTPSAVR